MKLFVYGTLKRGHCRAFVLQGQRFLREARTLPRYRLLDVGPYPAMIEVSPGGEGGAAIEGELWEIDEALLPTLDDVEGVDVQLFAGRAIEIEGEREVWAYFYLRECAHLPDLGTRWDRATPFAEL